MRYFSKSGFIISQTGEISLLRGLTSLPPALSKTPAAFSAPLKRFSHILPTSFFVRITVKVLGADHCISLFIKCLLYSQSFPECAIFLPRIRKNQVGIAIVRTNKMKTIRTILTAKRRRLFLLMIVSFIVFGRGMALGTQNKAFIALGLAGFIVAMGCTFGLLFFVRCPSCGGNLGYALSWPATWDLSVSNKIKFCQFCSTSLDKEI